MLKKVSVILPTYNEASYKPFVISALMFLERIADPAAKLDEIVARGRKLSI